ncbi:hypothetical protein Tco_1391050 [Tanacetum coccineum]
MEPPQALPQDPPQTLPQDPPQSRPRLALSQRYGVKYSGYSGAGTGESGACSRDYGASSSASWSHSDIKGKPHGGLSKALDIDV